tara:strand:- start:930 stop:1226 length:297 start_codon:yes stop_codon:yes gene_type:complete
MSDFDKTFENEVRLTNDDRGSLDLTLTIENLKKENYQLKKEMAIKVEEVQALYLEVKSVRKLEEDHQKLNGKLRLENKHLKQQIKQLEEEQEEMLNYP